MQGAQAELRRSSGEAQAKLRLPGGPFFNLFFALLFLFSSAKKKNYQTNSR